MGISKFIVANNARNGYKTTILLPENVIEHWDLMKNACRKRISLNPIFEFENYDGIRYQVYLEYNGKSTYAMFIRIKDNIVTNSIKLDEMTNGSYSKFLDSLIEIDRYVYLLELGEPINIYYPLYEFNSTHIKGIPLYECDEIVKDIAILNSAILTGSDILNFRKLYIRITDEIENNRNGDVLEEYKEEEESYNEFEDINPVNCSEYIIRIELFTNKQHNNRISVFANKSKGFCKLHSLLINKSMKTEAKDIRETIDIARKMLSEIQEGIRYKTELEERISKITNNKLDFQKRYDDSMIQYLSKYSSFNKIFNDAKRQYNILSKISNDLSYVNSNNGYADLYNYFHNNEIYRQNANRIRNNNESDDDKFVI